MCLQPCCHDKWIALSNANSLGSWLYDLNINTGRLTKPRFVGNFSNGLQQFIGPLARHPTTKKLYTFSHALTPPIPPDPGTTSKLYELRIDGSYTEIGALKAIYSGGDYSHTDGISAHCATFSSGGVMFAGSDNGNGSRNLKLMTINTTTGVRTAYTANYNNLAQVAEPPALIVDNVYGMAFHPVSGLLYGWAYDTLTGTKYKVTIDTTTGIFATKTASGLGSSDFILDLEFVRKPGGQVWAYSAGTSLFCCKDITAATPTFTKTDFTGLQAGSSETIQGIAHLG